VRRQNKNEWRVPVDRRCFCLLLCNIFQPTHVCVCNTPPVLMISFTSFPLFWSPGSYVRRTCNVQWPACYLFVRTSLRMGTPVFFSGRRYISFSIRRCDVRMYLTVSSRMIVSCVPDDLDDPGGLILLCFNWSGWSGPLLWVHSLLESRSTIFTKISLTPKV